MPREKTEITKNYTAKELKKLLKIEGELIMFGLDATTCRGNKPIDQRELVIKVLVVKK